MEHIKCTDTESFTLVDQFNHITATIWSRYYYLLSPLNRWENNTKRLSKLRESQRWYVMDLGLEPKKWNLNINLEVSFSCLQFLSGSPGLSGLEYELLHHLLVSLPSTDFPHIHAVFWTHQITYCPGACHVLSYITPLHVVVPLLRTLFLFFSPAVSTILSRLSIGVIYFFFFNATRKKFISKGSQMKR